MLNFEPNLDLLRQALGNNVQDCRAELIKTALGWSCVYRVILRYKQGHPQRDSVIVKAIDPKAEAEREFHFYQTLLPKLPIPKPEIHWLGTDDGSGYDVIVMEDLSYTHRIPQHPYQWTGAELASVLRAYALLHTAALPEDSLAYNWLAPRHESVIDFDHIPEQVDVVQRAGRWGSIPRLENLIACARESCIKYADEKMMLLHGDTTPTNAPLPKDLHAQPARPATLIDWQDVGIGMAEFDLAYIDLQPFHSGRLIPRSELSSHYWQFRAEIEGEIPSPEERAARQLHADLVMALWLTRSASRVSLRPFPEGTPQRAHWESQYDIIYRRLVELSDEVQ